jgi:hypothetical protein
MKISDNLISSLLQYTGMFRLVGSLLNEFFFSKHKLRGSQRLKYIGALCKNFF